MSDQSPLVEFLSRPESFGLPAETALAHEETHVSHIFLAGDRAYKMKKAVRFSFLDFSSLDRRRAACRRELEVNRRFTMVDLYLGLGGVFAGGSGLEFRFPLTDAALDSALEPVVVMRRFSQDAQLDRVAERGGLDETLAFRLGVWAARAAARAEPAAADWAAAFSRPAEANLSDLQQAEGVFEPGAVDALARDCRTWIARHQDNLAARERHDAIRRCHGDLHLGNIAIVDGRPTPFDALEFDERLATTDILFDAAFLAMDLIDRDLRGAAARVLAVFLPAIGDYSGAGLLPGYVAARAMVRADVAASRASQAAPADAETARAHARHYVALARSALQSPPPFLAAVGGLSGTGKSTLAFRLAEEVTPGAVVVGSDIVRKTLAGVDLFEEAPASVYAPDWNARTYDAMMKFAADALKSGAGVILDATFCDSASRTACRDLAAAHGVPFIGFWLEMDPAARLARVRARGRSGVSDADEAVAGRQRAEATLPPGWTGVDASGPTEILVQRCAEALKAAINDPGAPS